MNMKKGIKIVLGLAIIVGIALFGLIQYDLHRDFPLPQATLDNNSESQIARGEYIARASDCTACHTADKNQPFAGGVALKTPFGTILSSNITSDKETGIGAWNLADFDKSLRHGIGSNGYLYPAMPYNAYTLLSDQDVVDLWAYMKSIPAIKNEVVENQLPIPFNQRWSLYFWNLLYFKDARFSENTQLSALQNRGKYLIDGMGHCGACHTDKGPLGGDKSSGYLGGYALSGWYASDLTQNAHQGLGKWQSQDMIKYLKKGLNNYSEASGPMTEVIENSTQYLDDSDLDAMVAYLKSIPASDVVATQALDDSDPQMQLGRKIYEVQCASCHMPDGKGISGLMPGFFHNGDVNSVNPASLIATLLLGSPGVSTDDAEPTIGMPSFQGILSDEEMASVLTFIRNQWGNAATAVSVKEIQNAKKIFELNDN